MLQAVADGETSPTALAALADRRLRATPEQLGDALGACTGPRAHLPAVAGNDARRTPVTRHADGPARPGYGTAARVASGGRRAVGRSAGTRVDSAQQVIAEVGASATTFPSPQQLASWVGVCPGKEESAGVSYSHRSPHGNRQMRRLLNQAANAAVKTKGSLFQLVYRRLVPRLGHAQAIGAIAHRLCRLIWKILHEGVRYDERGPEVSRSRTQRRALKMIRELRSLGYRVDLIPSPPGAPA